MHQQYSIYLFLPFIISFLAFIVSLISLWKNYFTKFNPLCTTGDLSFRIYPIKSGPEKWYLPSYIIAVSITNKGNAMPGKVLGLRIVLSFPKLSIPDNREIFYPKWEIDYNKFKQKAKYRFNWIDEAVINDWMPFVVLPKMTVTKHLIFESRWEEPVIQDEILIKLEMFLDSKKNWVEIERWKTSLTPHYWSELVNRGTSFRIPPVESIRQESHLSPPDLHKYTGTTEPIPKGVNFEPSCLDYSESPEKGT